MRVFCTKSRFQSAMPYLVEESENHTVPSEAMAALLQNRIGVRRRSQPVTASIAPLAVSMRSSPRWASQTSSRPSRSISIPSGRPWVRAIRSTLPPSWLIRKIEPSSVPVKTAPSSAPEQPDDDVLGAGPGDGDDGEAHGVASFR